MDMLKIIGVALILAAAAWFEWPKIEADQKKEKKVFVIFSLISGGMLAVVILYPELPGPNKWMLELFKPMGEMMQKYKLAG